MKKRIIIILVIVVLIAAIALKLASNKKTIYDKKKPTLTSNVAIPVNTVVVGLLDANNQLVKTGNLIPFKEADIMAISSGKLVSVNFSLGSMVSQGGVVAQVDNRTLQLNLEQARLSKDKSDKDYKRYKTLLEGEAATEVNYQDAKLSSENAGNQIELIQKQMADNNIKSPVSGQVVSKTKEAGEFVNPGTVLGHVVDISQLKVNVLVGEKDAYTLQAGQKVIVTTDIYPDAKFEGKITFISGQGDATHNYQVEILLQNNGQHKLKAGTFVYADFARESQQKLMLIPRSALVESLKNPFVYVIENGKAVVRKISVGREFGDQIEVLTGLQEKEQVITAGQVNIKEGTLVKGIVAK